MLHTAPSFSIFNSPDGVEGEKKIEDEVADRQREDGVLLRPLRLGERVESGEFSFGKSASSMTLIEEKDDEEEEEKEDGLRVIGDVGMNNGVEVPSSPPMYLATGLGLGDGGDHVVPSFDDVAEAEEYYKRMVDENPSNALFLGTYAKLLESKGDLDGAEDYYFRASFIDPSDGEILVRYARLVWDLHHDQDRARDYFERATLASPGDSDILAAYARFLWKIEETNDEEPENDQMQIEDGITHVSNGGNDVTTSGGSTVDGVDTEEYYKRMVDDNPQNSIFLRNYAQFLHKTKVDLVEAEDKYARAVFADPTDGETILEYAKFIWEVHHDQRRASCCFEQAIQACPENSNILAAYARFLWEAEEDEEEDDVYKCPTIV